MIKGKMPIKLDNEIGLVRLAQSGNAEAFVILVNRYERQIYRLLRAATTNDEDAEESLESTFLNAHDNLGRFKGDERFYTWLARIAMNAALIKLRQRDAFTWDLFDERVDNADAVSTLGSIQDWSPNPRCSYSEAELDVILSRALEDLETPFRITFALGDIEGFSPEEIANVLGLPVQVAKTYWTRARLKLRSNLSRWFENVSVSASE